MKDEETNYSLDNSDNFDNPDCLDNSESFDNSESLDISSSTKIVDDNDNVTFVTSKRNNPRNKIFSSKDSSDLDHKPTKQTTKEPYVTKRFFIVCIVITLVLSSLISVLVTRFSSSSGFGGYDNLSASSLSNATGSKLSIQEIVSMNQDSVVEITTETASTGIFGEPTVSQGAGSGVIVNKEGYIVTNNHVIEDASTIEVTFHNGDKLRAALVGADPGNDIAVIKVPGKNFDPVELGDSTKLAVGDLAVAIGNPLGTLGGTATQGIISSLERRLTINNTTLNLLQTDAAINPGNSGGGLFNGAGQLVGIVVAKSSGTGIEGLAFAIPITSVADIIDDLIDDGNISSRPSIGITIYEVNDENKDYYKTSQEGIYISEVTGQNAKKAGLKPQDRIVSINGKKVTSASDLISRVRENKTGDTVTLGIEREGQSLTIKTVLEESIVSK